MVAKIGDMVRLNCDVADLDKGELFRVTGDRISSLSYEPVYDLIRLKNNEAVRGLYQFRFDLYKDNNRDMY